MLKTIQPLIALGLITAAESSFAEQVTALGAVHLAGNFSISQMEKPKSMEKLFGYEWDRTPCLTALMTVWQPSVASVARFKTTFLEANHDALLEITAPGSAYIANEITDLFESTPGFVATEEMIWVAFYLVAMDIRAEKIGAVHAATEQPDGYHEIVGGGVTVVNTESEGP